MKKRLRVGVLFGGRSEEHEVSLMSAESIMRAIDPERYEIVPIGIGKNGTWLTGADPLASLQAAAQSALPTGLIPSQLIADPQNPGVAPLRSGRLALDEREPIDLFFPVLHGPFGEDGTIQGLLEIAGVPYVGSGVAASAVGMDKALMRDVFRAHGLPLLDWVVVMRHEVEANLQDVLGRVEAALPYPCFVKPANLGSSIGISKADARDGLIRALNQAARFDRKLVVERGVSGWREVECAVLGNDRPHASIVGEIVPGGDFYDYKAKYVDDTSQLIIPARISEKTARRVQQLAIDAFTAIDAAGLSRVDFFVHPESEEVYLNEINTLPGFTRISMYPKLWEASGIGYAELVDRLIALALERHQDKQRSLTYNDGSEA